MFKRVVPKLDASPAGTAANARWRLGDFELDEVRHELRRGDRVVPIEPKPLHLLMLLVRHPGELITKDELVTRLWDGRPVTDTVMARCVAKLRAALGDRQDWIRTVHGYGYRYDGWVEPLTLPAAESLPTQLTAGTVLPGREQWSLQQRLGHSGETWLAQHDNGEQRVFKIALDATRLTALKREATVYRLLTASPATEGSAVTELVPLLDWNFHAAPYFLEFAYCPSGNLADWLARLPTPLTRPQRLALLVQLAEKLSGIHALGVLHKDLKPDNILVLADTAGALPRLALADFGSGGVVDIDRLRAMGIARMGLTVSTLDAESSNGTSLYLAPEVMAGRPWTRQADIYALGVLLYQLVVNDLRRPLAPGWERDIDDALLCEDIAAACDQSPAHRLVDAQELATRLSTLEQRRAHRAAAEATALEAIALRSSLARARTRRRWQGVVIVTLLLGIAASGTLYLKTRDAQQQAETAGATAAAVSQFLDDSVLGAADPYRAGGGRNVTIASVLDKAVQDFSKLDAHPQLQVRLGRTLASGYHNLGLEQQASAVGRAAVYAAQQSGIAADDAELNALRDRLGWIEISLAANREARVLFQQIIDHSNAPARVYKARYGLARVRYEEGYFAESAAQFKTLLDTTPPAQLDHWFANDLRWELAESEMELHHWAQAQTLLAQVRQHLEQQLNRDNAQLLWLNTSDAYCLQMLERFDAADALLNRTLAQSLRELGTQHPISMTVRQALAIVRLKQHRPAEALPLIETVLAWRTQHYGESHYVTRMTMGRKAEALIQLGRASEAEPLLRRGWQASITALGNDHPHTLDIERLLAECLAAQGRNAGAEILFRQVLNLGPQRMQARNNRLAWTRYGLGRLLLRKGDLAEAKALLQQAAADFQHNFPDGHSMQAVIAQLTSARPSTVVRPSPLS